jgi:lipoprotein-anchoring transpeptidase ErfK/SrfK
MSCLTSSLAAGAQQISGTGVSSPLERKYAALYTSVESERFPIPAVKLSNINSEYRRKVVFYRTQGQPNTIVIDPQNHLFYFIQGGGQAFRYGVGMGRQWFSWSGAATIHNKQE